MKTVTTRTSIEVHNFFLQLKVECSRMLAVLNDPLVQRYANDAVIHDRVWDSADAMQKLCAQLPESSEK